MLCIHLAQDENDCFSAWVSSKEAGIAVGDGPDQKGIEPVCCILIAEHLIISVVSDFDTCMLSRLDILLKP
jgi:hypothetical protein